MSTITDLQWQITFEYTGGDISAQGSGTTQTITPADKLMQSVEITMGLSQENMVCRATFSDMPYLTDIGNFMYVSGGLGGMQTLFNGELSSLAWDGNSAIVTALDYLARVRPPWGGDYYEYIEQTDGAVVTNLIEKCGVPPSLHSIQDSGWLIGTPEPIVLSGENAIVIDENGIPNLKGSQAISPLALIRAIDEATPLYGTCCRANGAIYRFPLAKGGSVATFAYGDDKTISVSRDYTITDLYTSIRVVGRTIAGVPLEFTADGGSGYVPDPPGFRRKTITNDFIQDATHAALVANAHLDEYDFPRTHVTVTTRLDGTVQPGNTITVNWPFARLYNRTIFVTDVTHRIPACTTTIRGETA